MQGVDFDNPEKSKSWLGLSHFDYQPHNDIEIEEGNQI